MEKDGIASDSEQFQDVLVVEDNPGDTRLIEVAFSEAHPETRLYTVSTGEEALHFVNRRGEYGDAPRPDVVFLDWSLPQMGGAEVLTELKTDRPDILVVVMTGSQPRKDTIESKIAQADAFLTKPTEPDGYLETIRTLK